MTQNVDYKVVTKYGFAGFASLLGSYFFALPLREEAAINLTSERLPTLFFCSLVCTLIASPAASGLIASGYRGGSFHSKGHQRVLYCFAALLLGEQVLPSCEHVSVMGHATQVM